MRRCWSNLSGRAERPGRARYLLPRLANAINQNPCDEVLVGATRSQ
jgi:hypothetical protein